MLKQHDLLIVCKVEERSVDAKKKDRFCRLVSYILDRQYRASPIQYGKWAGRFTAGVGFCGCGTRTVSAGSFGDEWTFPNPTANEGGRLNAGGNRLRAIMDGLVGWKVKLKE